MNLDQFDEPAFFKDRETNRLTQLVFDLAAQLHIERQRRLALETLLVRNGTVSETDLAALADDGAFLKEARAALDESQARLLTILIEGDDRRVPLREESKSTA